ncbi:MAG: lipopolysaccharide biosynthesis protein [Phycisphaerae bacterium]|nr:lipopolysaccharide biosynthesis protein [Phycisphaerae bacterium]
MSKALGRKKFLKDYIAVGLSLSLQSLRPLVFIPIIIQYMGKEAYGVWAQVLVTSMFLGPFLTLRFMSALSRYLAGSKNDRDISRAYLFSLVVVTGMSSIMFVLTALFPGAISSIVFGDASLTNYVWAGMVYACCSAMLSMLVTYFYTMGRQVTYSIIRAVEILGECALMVFPILFMKPWRDVSQCIYVLASWQGLVALTILCTIVYRHGWFRPSVRGFEGLWRFSFSMLIMHVLFFAASNASRYVIVGLLGLERVAVYMVAYQVAHIIGLVGAPNQMVLLPTLSTHWNNGKPELARPIVRLALLTQTFLGLTMLVTIQQLSGPLVLGLTKKSLVPEPLLILCLSVGVWLYGMFQLCEMAFRMTRRFLPLQITISAGGAVNIVLPFLLIPHVGLLGAGIAYLASMAVMAIPTYYMSTRIFGAGVDWVRTGKILVLAVIVYLALAPVHWIPAGNLIKLIAGGVIALVVTAVLFFLLRIYSWRELLALRERFRRRPQTPLLEEEEESLEA